MCMSFQGPSTSGVKPCHRCPPRSDHMDHPAMEPSVPGMLGVAYKLTVETVGDIQADNYYLYSDVLPEDRSDCHIPDFTDIFPKRQPKPTTTEPPQILSDRKEDVHSFIVVPPFPDIVPSTAPFCYPVKDIQYNSTRAISVTTLISFTNKYLYRSTLYCLNCLHSTHFTSCTADAKNNLCMACIYIVLFSFCSYKDSLCFVFQSLWHFESLLAALLPSHLPNFMVKQAFPWCQIEYRPPRKLTSGSLFHYRILTCPMENLSISCYINMCSYMSCYLYVY